MALRALALGPRVAAGAREEGDEAGIRGSLRKSALGQATALTERGRSGFLDDLKDIKVKALLGPHLPGFPRAMLGLPEQGCNPDPKPTLTGRPGRVGAPRDARLREQT